MTDNPSFTSRENARFRYLYILGRDLGLSDSPLLSFDIRPLGLLGLCLSYHYNGTNGICNRESNNKP